MLEYQYLHFNLKGVIALNPGIDIHTGASYLDLIGTMFNESKFCAHLILRNVYHSDEFFIRFLNKGCDYPNKEATQCFKPTISSSHSLILAKCTAQIPFDCGTFCTTSQAQCAKLTAHMASLIMYIVASVTGAPDALQALKHLPVNLLKKATNIIRKKSISFWINVLKKSANQESDYAAAIQGLESVADLFLPSFKFKCKKIN